VAPARFERRYEVLGALDVYGEEEFEWRNVDVSKAKIAAVVVDDTTGTVFTADEYLVIQAWSGYARKVCPPPCSHYSQKRRPMERMFTMRHTLDTSGIVQLGVGSNGVLYSGSSTGFMAWAVATGAPRRTFRVPEWISFVVAATGTVYTCSSNTAIVDVWSAADNTHRHTWELLKGSTRPLLRAAMHVDNAASLLYAAVGAKVVVLCLKTHAATRSVDLPGRSICSIVALADGTIFIASKPQPNRAGREMGPGTVLHRVRGSEVQSLADGPGERAVALSPAGAVFFWSNQNLDVLPGGLPPAISIPFGRYSGWMIRVAPATNGVVYITVEHTLLMY
jgi:hypothetical protein